jgi:hypothetical protein
MTRRKLCVVCGERPAMPDDNWCWRCHDLILPDEIDALYRVARRARMCERRRWLRAFVDLGLPYGRENDLYCRLLRRVRGR